MPAHEAFAQRPSAQGCAARAAEPGGREGALTPGAGSELTAALMGRVASRILLAGYVFNRVP